MWTNLCRLKFCHLSVDENLKPVFIVSMFVWTSDLGTQITLHSHRLESVCTSYKSKCFTDELLLYASTLCNCEQTFNWLRTEEVTEHVLTNALKWFWNWFWILNDDDYKRSPSTETKDKRTRQTLCGDEAPAQTHTGDGGVNCNSAALTGPSLNNRKAEIQKKNSHSGHVAAQTSSTLHTHVSCVLMRSLHGSTQPGEPHFNIHYYYYHDYNIPSLIRTPGLQTSTQSHVSTLWHLYCRSTGASPRCVRYRMNMWWFYTDSSWKFNLNSWSAL